MKVEDRDELSKEIRIAFEWYVVLGTAHDRIDWTMLLTTRKVEISSSGSFMPLLPDVAWMVGLKGTPDHRTVC